MRPKKANRWECQSCGELHKSMKEAQICCDIDPTEGFTCGECDEFYEDKEDAKDCCKD